MSLILLFSHNITRQPEAIFPIMTKLEISKCELFFAVLKTLIAMVHEAKKAIQMWHLWLQMFSKECQEKTCCIRSWRKKASQFDFCDYSSSQIENLNKHVAMVHEEKKPFKSDICDLCWIHSCRKKAIQMQHMKQHVKKKDKDNVSIHMKTYIPYSRE